MSAPTRAQIEALIGEYRTTMDVHVLHSWAADAIKLLRAMTPAEPQPAPVEPVAHAYVVDDECEGIQWGLDIDLPDDPALVLLYPPRVAQTPPAEDVGAWRDVLAERKRQVEAEGWTTELDDVHELGELSLAAACYAISGTPADEAQYIHGRWKDARDMYWPWSREWWKPVDRRRDLVRSGALILAEIERLDRAALAKQGGA